MNILVINPPNKPFTNIGLLAEPIDVLQIATVVEEKYESVKVIDMDVNRNENNINIHLQKKDNIIVFVYDYQIPLHTTDTINNIFEIIKNVDKTSKFIIIGKTSSYYYNRFLENGIDVIISGQAEDRINDVIENINNFSKLKLIQGLYIKENEKIINTGPVDRQRIFNSLPIPNRSLLDISKYINTRTIITSRGCSGKCSYCSTPFYFGSWISKPYNIVVDEIEYLVNKYQTFQIIFLDDNATVDKKRMTDICNEIIKRKINIKLGCLSSINHYDKDLFKLMYKSGFKWIHFGIESGSQKILELMNKPMNVDYIRVVINECNNIGYRIRTSWILDYPDSTLEDLEKTINFILELSTDEIRLHFLSYRVGTPIFKDNEEIQEQYIHKNVSSFNDSIFNDNIKNLLNKLKENGYIVIDKEIDWEEHKDKKGIKLVSLVPMRYGVNWDE